MSTEPLDDRHFFRVERLADVVDDPGNSRFSPAVVLVPVPGEQAIVPDEVQEFLLRRHAAQYPGQQQAGC